MATPKTRQVTVGDRFGRWTVTGAGVKLPRGRSLRRAFPVRCDCGTERIHFYDELRSGETNSCGCLRRELTAARSTTHGRGRERLQKTWRNMLARCNNPNYPAFADYGGRGITVCPEWQHYEPFRAWALASGYTDSLTIDRADNDSGYSPENCRWITQAAQMDNRRGGVRLTAFGETKSRTQWAADARCVVSSRLVHRRTQAGGRLSALGRGGGYVPQRSVCETSQE